MKGNMLLCDCKLLSPKSVGLCIFEGLYNLKMNNYNVPVTVSFVENKSDEIQI